MYSQNVRVCRGLCMFACVCAQNSLYGHDLRFTNTLIITIVIYTTASNNNNEGHRCDKFTNLSSLPRCHVLLLKEDPGCFVCSFQTLLHHVAAVRKHFSLNCSTLNVHQLRITLKGKLSALVTGCCLFSLPLSGTTFLFASDAVVLSHSSNRLLKPFFLLLPLPSYSNPLTSIESCSCIFLFVRLLYF